MQDSSTMPTREVDGLAARLDFVVSGPAEEALTRIGRTEDIRFSADGKRLAIAGFGKSAVFLLDVEIDRRAARPVVRISDYLELQSPRLANPHGFDFIDDRTLVVANRSGRVTIFDIPVREADHRVRQVEPLKVIRQLGWFGKITHPGSVAVLAADCGRYEIAVCNNYTHIVSRHVFGLNKLVLPVDEVLLERGLLVPDGIAVSRDRRWIAVSNHASRSVNIYDNAGKLDRGAEPSAILFGVNYPHGLRFSPDGKRLYVADAGRPYVCVFDAEDGLWSGSRDATTRALALTEKLFHRGHTNAAEGGPKGLDIDASGQVMAITCEQQALAFFDVPAMFGRN